MPKWTCFCHSGLQKHLLKEKVRMGDYEMVSTNPTTDLNPNGEMAKRPLINGDTEKAHVNASFLKKIYSRIPTQIFPDFMI